MPRARRYETDYDELHYDAIVHHDVSNNAAPAGAGYHLNEPSRRNIRFRLAAEEDRERLEDITIDAVMPNDGSVHGHQIAYAPEEYWEAFDRSFMTIPKNDFFTCVVAEFVGQGFTIPDGAILGYTLWGWAEYTKEEDGGTTVRMGMLPRVFELWDKYLGDSKKPTDDPAYTPRIVEHRVPPRPEHEHDGRRRARAGRRLEQWILQDIKWDPRLDRTDLVQPLAAWGCNIVDKEQIRLALTCPWEMMPFFMRFGFRERDCGDYPDYRLRDREGFVHVLEMVKMRRKPKRVRVGNANRNANGNGNTNGIGNVNINTNANASNNADNNVQR